MNKQQSSVDVAVELLRDLEEFQRTGSKEALRETIREEFVRRSGASSPEQALVMAMDAVIKELKSTK
jgi:hypothetical protein